MTERDSGNIVWILILIVTAIIGWLVFEAYKQEQEAKLACFSIDGNWVVTKQYWIPNNHYDSNGHFLYMSMDEVTEYGCDRDRQLPVEKP